MRFKALALISGLGLGLLLLAGSAGSAVYGQAATKTDSSMDRLIALDLPEPRLAAVVAELGKK